MNIEQGTFTSLAMSPNGGCGKKSSEVTGFILVFAVMLKWRKTPVKKSSLYWSCRFYTSILCKFVITF